MTDEEAYRVWYDSEDGPGSHDIYDSDLERAFLAGRRSARNEEAAQ